MSEEIKETLTEKEAMEAIGAFANMCYDKGVRDTLIGVVVGAVVSTLFMAGVEAIGVWKDRKKTEKQIKEFNEFIIKGGSPNKGSFFFFVWGRIFKGLENDKD